MTSVTMALRTRGSNLDPGSYNQWLTNNGQNTNTDIRQRTRISNDQDMTVGGASHCTLLRSRASCLPLRSG